ncbi:uncharacterized protein LOC144664717 [Oculina patagonica]
MQSLFRMEPDVKRLKTDKDNTENGISYAKALISTQSPCDGTESSDKQTVETEGSLDAGKDSNEQLPVCKHGVECTETDLIHFAEFWHPTEKDDGDQNNNKEDESCEENECEVLELPYDEATATQPVFDEFSDSDSENGEDDNSVIVKSHEERLGSDSWGSQLSRDDTVLSRGPSIVKCYSLLSETERRELIRRAFEMKDLLKKELDKTLGIIEEKNKELRRVHSQLERGHLMVDGEKEALEKDDLCYFPLFAEREYKEGSAAQMHFRLAESQFYRLVDTTDKYRVTKVEYVVNPVMIRRFQKARQKLKKVRGEKMSYPVLAFHGTKETNIHSICNTGFRVPGDANFEHATDTGFYGRGVYFSEYPSYSMTFIRGASRLLLCQVLPGKVYRCINLIHGEPLEMGHDSHTSPDGKELVIFNSYHILPSYVVHYGEAKGDFLYEATDT